MRTAHSRSGKPLTAVLSLVPVAVALSLIGLSYHIHVFTIFLPLWRDDRIRLAASYFVSYHSILGMVLWSYAVVMFTDPGRVVEEELDLIQESKGMDDNGTIQTHVIPDDAVLEHGQQHNKWCNKCARAKPERAHHCRVCNRCVLKMDHHCPWVFNCIGQNNHKAFFLFVMYTTLLCFYIVATVLPICVEHPEDKSWQRQEQIIGVVIIAVIGICLFLFFLSNLRLVLLNRTTIEDHSAPEDEDIFLILRRPRGSSYHNSHHHHHHPTLQSEEQNMDSDSVATRYDRGSKRNWEQIMGSGWKGFLPMDPPPPVLASGDDSQSEPKYHFYRPRGRDRNVDSKASVTARADARHEDVYHRSYTPSPSTNSE